MRNLVVVFIVIWLFAGCQSWPKIEVDNGKICDCVNEIPQVSGNPHYLETRLASCVDEQIVSALISMKLNEVDPDHYSSTVFRIFDELSLSCAEFEPIYAIVAADFEFVFSENNTFVRSENRKCSLLASGEYYQVMGPDTVFISIRENIQEVNVPSISLREFREMNFTDSCSYTLTTIESNYPLQLFFKEPSIMECEIIATTNKEISVRSFFGSDDNGITFTLYRNDNCGSLACGSSVLERFEILRLGHPNLGDWREG